MQRICLTCIVSFASTALTLLGADLGKVPVMAFFGADATANCDRLLEDATAHQSEQLHPAQGMQVLTWEDAPVLHNVV